MSNPGLRARVLRLLSEDYRLEDLNKLFLYCRDKCSGRESVREVGDFVAHSHLREKGVVTNEVRDWHAIVSFKIQATGLRENIDVNCLPPVFPLFLRATGNRISAEIIKKDTGLNLPAARKSISHIIKKLNRNPDGTYSITNRTHTAQEHQIIQALCNYIVVRPAFDGDRLFGDFLATLKSQALLLKAEIGQFSKVKPFIVLYAVTSMHNCAIKVDEHSSLTLELCVGEHISIGAAVPINDKVRMSASMFDTDLPVNTYCQEKMLSRMKFANCDIEVKLPEMQLGILG